LDRCPPRQRSGSSCKHRCEAGCERADSVALMASIYPTPTELEAECGTPFQLSPMRWERNEDFTLHVNTLGSHPPEFLSEWARLPAADRKLVKVRQCVRCAGLSPVAPCTNCDGRTFAQCVVRGGGDGIMCATCQLGETRWTCPRCQTSNPYPSTLRFLEPIRQATNSGRAGSFQPCFVATAATGSEASPEVESLRRLRDEVLRTIPPGRQFIHAYEAVGPTMAAVIRNHRSLRLLALYGVVVPGSWLARVALRLRSHRGV